jgi:hypothetical protein
LAVVIIRQATQERPNAPNESADEQHIKTEDSDLVDNRAPACIKRKREENSGGGTCKKIKVS